MNEMVRRLMRNHSNNVKSLKESLPVAGLKEADEEDEIPAEDELDSGDPAEEMLDDEFGENPEDEFGDDDLGGDNMAPSMSGPSSHPSVSSDPVMDDDTVDDPDELADTPVEKEHANPLENDYAVNYKMGQEVALTYANGTKSKLKGIIDGYDSEGFYRVKWGNGMTTNGITDIALADLIDAKLESKCICGGTRFVNESHRLVCDRCGRLIRESCDPLTLADKSRPKGKKLIRSEAHPISTSMGESIRKAFKSKPKKSMKESRNEVLEYLPRLEELDGQFWTRMNELEEDITELGYEVLQISAESVLIIDPDEEDVEISIPIVGTSRTMTLDIDKGRVL